MWSSSHVDCINVDMRILEADIEVMLTVKPGLADVVAFDTGIAEPDRSGGSLRYRGIDIEKLIGRATFADVWGLLVDGDFTRGLPAAEPLALPVAPATSGWTCRPPRPCSPSDGGCPR
jgi:citrate synthase